jgi:membrane protein
VIDSSVTIRGALHRFWWLFKRSWISSYKDNVFGIAKGAAYSALLAFFPLLTTITAILVQANADAVSRRLTGLLFEVVPPGTHEMIRTHFIERGYRPILILLAGGFVSLLAASGLMMSMMEGFRAAYRISSGRPFWRQRGVAALLVIVAALPVVMASSAMVIGTRVETALLRGVGIHPQGEAVRGWVQLLGFAMRYLLALAAIALSVTAMYYIGPNHTDRRPHTVWPGALVATVLWLVATVAFAWYVRNIANYNLMYGSVAAVIALLVWMYVLSVVVLVGCEFNAERERAREAGLTL